MEIQTCIFDKPREQEENKEIQKYLETYANKNIIQRNLLCTRKSTLGEFIMINVNIKKDE